MEYIKNIHITFAALSFCGFFVRGVWMLSGSDLLQLKWVKIIPHGVDAVLLGTALALLYQSHWSVLDHHWLQMKIVALLVYIGLGMIALRFGKTRKVRFMAWISALLVFLFIVSVALSKSAYGFF